MTPPRRLALATRRQKPSAATVSSPPLLQSRRRQRAPAGEARSGPKEGGGGALSPAGEAHCSLARFGDLELGGLRASDPPDACPWGRDGAAGCAPVQQLVRARPSCDVEVLGAITARRGGQGRRGRMHRCPWVMLGDAGSPRRAASGLARPDLVGPCWPDLAFGGQRLSAAGLRGGSLTGWWSTVAWSG